VVERHMAGVTTGLPQEIAGIKPPSFAAIVTVREAGQFLNIALNDAAGLDRDLAAIPLARADKVARCARYDTTPPRLAIPQGHARILLFEKINGFRDSPSVDAAHAALVAMAARKGWALVTTDNGAAFSPAILRRFDAVIWNNISGDVLTLSQRATFRTWMEQGGGYLGIHGSAGDPVTFWDWYVDDLIGARFIGHPMAPQFQSAKVRLEDAAHPAIKGLPINWDMTEEWYSFKASPRKQGVHVIATLDESTYSPVGVNGQDLRMGDHPLIWTRCIGKGRMFYSAIGHRPEHYTDPLYVRLLEQATDWAAGLEGKRCR
jgi:type 1 glutamine amidotransferase